MGQATTAASGGRSAGTGSSAGRSSPTGRQTGSARSDGGRRGRRRKRRQRPGFRLFRFDRELGSRLVAGADEAGRGSLAGPLVAAAVLFDYERLSDADRLSLAALNDSKRLDRELREQLYPRVLSAAAAVAVTARCVRGIDSRGLHVTNLAALRDCLARVARDGALCLVDGFKVPDLGAPQRPIVEGDSTSAAIAAASVIAKVTRDRYMQRAAEIYPHWGFDSSVGYSTPEHRAAILANGITELHRRSFQSIAYSQLALET